MALKYWDQAQAAMDEPLTPDATVVDARDDRRFLIFVRHARRKRSASTREEKQRMDGWPSNQSPSQAIDELDGKSKRKSGWQTTLDVAMSLAEWAEAEKVRVTHIFYSTHEVARQTAKVYAAALCRREAAVLAPLPWLSPEKSRWSTRQEIQEQLDKLRKCPPLPRPKRASPDTVTKTNESDTDPRREGQAIILVGHQPHLTRIANVVLQRFALPLPLGSSEAACVGLTPRRRLRWLLTEKPDSLASEIKDKLKSKVEIAKFFLGALAVNAGLLVNTGVWSGVGREQLWVLAFGALFILIGLLLAIATLFGYDTLSMPSAFWAETTHFDQRKKDRVPPRHTVFRPPSEATVLLFYEMIKIWKRFFLPALGFSVAGVALFLMTLVMSRFDALDAKVSPAAMNLQRWIIALAVVAVVAIIIRWCYHKAGPNLGLED
jgi:phosphohistidine phosphatase SixA